MKAKILFGAALWFCGLAQAQWQEQWPSGFFKNDNQPTLLAESMHYEIDETLSQVSSQPAAGAPQRVWVARYKGKKNWLVKDIAIDWTGEVYVAGILRRIYDTDFFAIKYNSNGLKEWVAAKDNVGDGNQFYYLEASAKIIADYKNNIYVAGSSGNLLGTAYATLKYNKWSGDRLWTKYYTKYGNGSGYNGNLVSDFVIDHAGNVYVAGYSLDSSGVYHYATVKYNKAGNEQWVRHYGKGYNSSVAAAIALDPIGNVCVTGTGYDSVANRFVFTTIKYNPAGKTLWTRHYLPPGYYGGDSHAIAIDAAGNVYVTGNNDPYYYYPNVTVVKYDPAGKLLMSRNLTLSREYYSDGIHLWVDRFQNVYLTGAGISRTRYIIMKIDYTGRFWFVSYGGGNGSVAVVSDMFVDDAGNVYVTGSSSPSAIAQNWDYLTVKYDTQGRLQWTLRYNGPQNGNDYARALAVDGSGNVYVTGESYGPGQNDIVTIKYSQNLSNASGSASKLADIESASEINLPENFYLEPNHPNPFNPSTTIRFGLPHAARVTLKVYNVLSEEVATLVNEQKSAGVHAVNFTPTDLPSGIYFYALQAGAVRLVERMIYAK